MHNLVPKALALKKDTLVREYWEKVDEILRYAREGIRERPGPTPGPTKGSAENETSQSEESSSSKPASKYFATTNFTPVAILATGDKSYKDLSLSFWQWLDDNGYSATTGLFRPGFWGAYRSRLIDRDTGVFTENNVSELANCVCLFDQSAKLEESTVAGEKLITAIFSGKVTLFNLKDSKVENFEFNVRGSGIIAARAMENVEEKLKVEFASLTSNLTSCY